MNHPEQRVFVILKQKNMTLKELVLKNRSYRRFDERVRISDQQLYDWIELARFSASARNAQPLKYLPVTDPESCNSLFPLLAWAGYLKNWDGPAVGEHPSAYIIMVNDTSIATNYYCDDGIAAQSILLGATEAGFGGCIVASIKKEKLAKLFRLDEQYRVIMVIALGKPIEQVVVEDMKGGDFKYWRDTDLVHHVPKRPMNELIISR